jgi:ATP-dependent Lon protease
MLTLIRVDDRLEVTSPLPVIPLRDLVFFPYVVLPLLVGRPRSVVALRRALEGDGLVFLLAQRNPEVEEPRESDLYSVGTVARVIECEPAGDATLRVVLEGLGRARMGQLLPPGGAADPLRAALDPGEVLERAEDPVPAEVSRLQSQLRKLYSDYASLHERIPEGTAPSLTGPGDPIRQGHLLTGHLLVPPAERQRILEEWDPVSRLAALRDLIQREIEVLRVESRIDEEIRRQRELDRRLPAGPFQGGSDAEWVDVERAVAGATLPPHARERAERELSRLRRLNPVSPEAAVIRSYIDWIVGLPWGSASVEQPDVARASGILDAAHYGLGEVKERILDHIAVLSLVEGELRGPILCLVGPPGVGKTSLGRSIARALGREFVRVSLGGVRDEAEIRGHRRTYVGALPGRIVQGMRRSGTRNPVFLLDEVDKLARDSHGDPAAALLEVLDPEQNQAFTDHYLELDYDLSGVLWLATANTLAGIPEPLRDRMEVIRLPGYLDTEKRVIARQFLWPRQLGRHGLSGEPVHLADDALSRILDRYTREAGVRELDRRLSQVVRKVARAIAEGRSERGHGIAVGPDEIREFLGPPPHDRSNGNSAVDRTGIANGLAWTQEGGVLLDVEVSVVPGNGEMQLTGTLGAVMKESAQAALTYARSRARALGLDPLFHREVDIHVHIPEGATPKDGPSAGITMAVALVSALTGTPTRADVAMTGEITLRGRVLPVGGIREKAVAALRSGMSTMILPRGNAPELELLPAEVRDRLAFVAVTTMDEVLEGALLPAGAQGTSPALLQPEGGRLLQ